uniref:Major facilitator superfamily (MFS) profile domain-containing protein n=1 Tax=Odontella aurita TaxID=265563 RepID=A0A7S4MS80_9STRA|mmetsp:Transcript_30405/g.90717  ORF Transcript_30405/g.90717 Transcript_30405/m.90717 type:complete len:500 (+) Transcript_30405:358-1857(+)
MYDWQTDAFLYWRTVQRLTEEMRIECRCTNVGLNPRVRGSKEGLVQLHPMAVIILFLLPRNSCARASAVSTLAGVPLSPRLMRRNPSVDSHKLLQLFAKKDQEEQHVIRRTQMVTFADIRGGGQRNKNPSAPASLLASDNIVSSTTLIRQRLVLLLAAFALFNDLLQITMILPILPTLISSPPPLGVESNAEIAMGIFFASKDILQLSTAPLAGMLTARTSAAAALLLSTVALGLATFVFADATTFGQLLFARSCQGAASAATLCGGLSLVSENFPAEVRGAAMGIAYTGLALGLLCGPLVGGLLFDRFGRRKAFRIAAAMVLANAVGQVGLLVLFPSLASPAKKDGAGKQKSKKGLRQSLGGLLANRDVRYVALATAAVNGALGVLKPLSQVVLHREFKMDVTRRSLVISIATATYLVITPIAGNLSDRMPRAHLVALSLILMASSMALFMARNLGLWALNICVGLAGAGLACAGSVGQVSTTFTAQLFCSELLCLNR